MLNLNVTSTIQIPLTVTAGREQEQAEAAAAILAALSEPERLLLAKALKRPSLKSKAITYLKTVL